jgi:hypothetical protein
VDGSHTDRISVSAAQEMLRFFLEHPQQKGVNGRDCGWIDKYRHRPYPLAAVDFETHGQLRV